MAQLKKSKPMGPFWSFNYPEFEGLTVQWYVLHSCETEHVPSFRWAKVRPFFSSLLVVLMVKPKMRSALQSKLLRVRACPSNVWPVMEFWHINKHFSKLRPQSRYPKIEWNLVKPRETSCNVVSLKGKCIVLIDFWHVKMFCRLIWIFFFAIELPRETLYVLSCVRFPCQMTKRFIYAVDISMWKKNISLRYQ